MNPLYLLILICFAVAALPAFALPLYRRMIEVELLRYKCDFAFNQTVRNNEQLKPEMRDWLTANYEQDKPSYLAMYFSKKPLKIESWYNQEQIDAFFLPATDLPSYE